MSAASPSRKQIFISYSHQDEDFLRRLKVHLAPLEHDGTVDRWDDTRIRTGQRWREEIEKALAAAKIAVLLVSADFLASDFIQSNELPELLKAEEQRGLVIMSVILKPCRFDRSALADFQAVNGPSRPMAGLAEHEQEAFWVKLTQEIEALPSPP